MFDLTLTVSDLFNGRISAGSRDMAIGDISDPITRESSNSTIVSKYIV